VQNIGRIDMHKSGSVKLTALRNFMVAAKVNISAITECNVAWNKTPMHLYPSEQPGTGWWESSHWSLGHNKQETNDAPYQPGGTGLIVVNKLSHRAEHPGDDTVGLGGTITRK